MNLSELFRELRRRKVFRVAVVYAVVGWLVIQVAHIVLPGLGLPGWPVQLVIVLVLLGFPIALVLGWAFELTPEGVQRDSGVVDAAPAEAGGAAPSPRRGPGAGTLAVGGLALVAAAFAWISIRGGGEEVGAPVSGSHLGSVAVLPFALAYAALGDAYLVLPFYDPSVSVPEGVELARAAALRALALDPGLGEAHATLAHASTLSWDWEGAERHFARALEATPGYAGAHHWHGTYFVALRRYDEAVPHLRRAVELDPFSARLHRDLAGGLSWAGRDAQALEAIERGEELNPGFVDFYPIAWAVYVESGKDAQALEALVRLQELAGGSAVSPDELRSAFREEGLRAAVRLAVERAPETLGSSWDLARFQVYLGDAGAALGSLERAVDARETYSAWVAADPTIVAFLIDEPRFREVARRIGVPLP